MRPPDGAVPSTSALPCADAVMKEACGGALEFTLFAGPSRRLCGALWLESTRSTCSASGVSRGILQVRFACSLPRLDYLLPGLLLCFLKVRAGVGSCPCEKTNKVGAVGGSTSGSLDAMFASLPKMPRSRSPSPPHGACRLIVPAYLLPHLTNPINACGSR